jgi:uncharacterized membrane protein YbhN (UPF0104 family)
VKKLSPALQRALSWLLIAAAFGFLGRSIYRHREQLRAFHWDVRPGLLALSVVALCLVLLVGVAVWQQVLARCGARVSFLPLARAWFVSNFSRYIPGVVWQFLSLAQLGSSVGLPGSAMVTSLLVHMVFLLLSAGMVGVWMLPLSVAGRLAGVLPVLRWIAPIGFALVHPRVIRAGVRAFAKVTRKGELDWRGGWGDGLLLLALGALQWMLYGGAFYLFLRSFVPLPTSALPAVIAINALSFIVGYVVVIAPGGLGFREAALTLLLGAFVPTGVAASLSLVSRLWTVAGEIIPGGILLVMLREKDMRGDAGEKQSAKFSR